jgi:hypothetical protein
MEPITLTPTEFNATEAILALNPSQSPLIVGKHSHPPIKRSRKPNTTRDQRRDIKMAARCGCTTKQIAIMLCLNSRQVLKALEDPDTPKKSTGRPPTLGTEQRQ